MTDGQEILKILAKVLKSLANHYNVPGDQVGLMRYNSGVILVKVADLQEYWFFDEQELISWLKEMSNGIH